MEERFALYVLLCCVAANVGFSWAHINGFGEQPLSKIAIHKAIAAFHDSASIRAHPVLLGLKVTRQFFFTFLNATLRISFHHY